MNDDSTSKGDFPGIRYVPTAAELHALARIYTWNVREWQPKSERKAAFVILDDPQRSSVNSRTTNQLLVAGLLQEVGGTLVVTEEGARALLERPELMLRMRASGAI